MEYAVDVANYMAEEIKNNIELKNTEDMAKNNKVIKTFKWYNSVRSDEEWDHKWQLSALFPSMGLSRRYYHMYNNTEIYYDIWSNIHYGVIGSIVYNHDYEYILNGAGQAQRWSGGNVIDKASVLWDYFSGLKKGSEHDDPKDRSYINEGIMLYDNKKNITAEQLLEIAVKQPVIDNKDLTDVEYK